MIGIHSTLDLSASIHDPLMPSTDAPPSESSASSADGHQRFATVRMPLEEPVENLEEAVRELRECSSTKLRRARQHHERALEALQNGGYNALSDATRSHLVDRLRNNLRALKRALDAKSDSCRASGSSENQNTSFQNSFSSRFRAFFHGLW